ncbi:hypothetical protein [Mesorhizobium sp.]|uniref:hypothetical protein n=1 Tax=Mesorhizobium sp. TaxID=1871066 RepID=UPI00142FF94E|nr:hypothetical protein [Mesorhizobium sp.]
MRWIGWFQAQDVQYFSFTPSPDAGSDDAWRSTLGTHRVAEMVAATGAIGKPLAGVVRQSIGTGFAVVMLAGVTAISSTGAVSASAPTWALKP